VAVALIVMLCIVLAIVLFALFTMFVLVHRQRSVVIERLGTFNRILGPGPQRSAWMRALLPSGPGAVTDLFTQFAGMQTSVKAPRVSSDWTKP
jgi:hypothetical protein